MSDDPSPGVRGAATRALGEEPKQWRRVVGGGYTPAERWTVSLPGGATAFVKAGVTPLTAGWLRVEARAYSDIRGEFIPRRLGWADGDVPILALQDLSAGHWPPPWHPRLVEKMLSTLAAIASTPCPHWARPAADMHHIFSGWSRVAADPAPFLSLGVASGDWLEHALPGLIAHENPPEIEGDALLHFDVRSDNMCFTADRALLVDWNWVSRGNPLFDVAAWLPSLHYEGGPAPEEVSEDAGVFAAALAGYFASHAGLPGIADAPHVRTVQREQLTTALPWAARVLGLAPPDLITPA